MTTPSDKALAQAFVERFERRYTPLTVRLVAWHGKPIASMKTTWRKLRKRAYLPEDVVPKTVRHTMATELRAANVPEAEIAGMLGHRAFGGKTEVYAKYRPDYLGGAARAIDAYMGRVRASCVLAL